MKGAVLIFIATVMIIVGLHAFRAFQDTTVSGRITPADAVAQVMAIKGKDTVKGSPAKEGTFILKVTPGSWKILITANAPYKNAVLERVQTKEGYATDVGIIKLEQ